jgi:hypothetical protein
MSSASPSDFLPPGANAAYASAMLSADHLHPERLDASRFEIRTSAAGAAVVVLKGEKWSEADGAAGAAAASGGAAGGKGECADAA